MLYVLVQLKGRLNFFPPKKGQLKLFYLRKAISFEWKQKVYCFGRKEHNNIFFIKDECLCGGDEMENVNMLPIGWLAKKCDFYGGIGSKAVDTGLRP